MAITDSEKSAPKNDGALTADEVDALLSGVGTGFTGGSGGALTDAEIAALLTTINDSDKSRLYRTKPSLPAGTIHDAAPKAPASSGKTNVLTEEEVSQLLAAMDAGSKTVDALTLIHKELTKKLSCFLSAYLKSKVLVNVSSVYDILTFNEYLQRMHTPTHLSIISLPPLKERAIIEISSSVYSPILDVVFRGSGNNKKYKSELTNLEKLEKFVLEKLVAHSFRAICGSWKKAIKFYPELTVTETYPQETVKIFPLDKEMLVAACNCKINDAEGRINIYYPYRLGTIIARLGRKQ